MSTIIASTVSVSQETRVERDQPVCITQSQKDILSDGWGKIEDNQLNVGLLLFERLFQIAPQAIALFPKFSDVPADKRENDENYRAHALRVVEAVGLAISMLDDLTDVENVLSDLGSTHCQHSVEDAHFELVGQALMWTLEKGLGSDFTATVRDAWSTFYSFVSLHMQRGLHQARDALSD